MANGFPDVLVSFAAAADASQRTHGHNRPSDIFLIPIQKIPKTDSVRFFLRSSFIFQLEIHSHSDAARNRCLSGTCIFLYGAADCTDSG